MNRGVDDVQPGDFDDLRAVALDPHTALVAPALSSSSTSLPSMRKTGWYQRGHFLGVALDVMADERAAEAVLCWCWESCHGSTGR